MSSGHRFFFGKVSNCWLNSYGKFGGPFFAICEKPEGGGGITAPPAVRGITLVSITNKSKHWRIQRASGADAPPVVSEISENFTFSVGKRNVSKFCETTLF